METEGQTERSDGGLSRPETDGFEPILDDLRDSPALRSLHADDRVLLAEVPDQLLLGLGMPPPDLARDRSAAYQAVLDVLQSGPMAGNTDLIDEFITVSPLGPAWSSDIDIDGQIDNSIDGEINNDADGARRPNLESALLTRSGWLCADPFLQRLGSPGAGRWLITEDDRVIGQADVGPKPVKVELATKVIRRARARGRVDLRDTLELRHALRSGSELPVHEVVTAAARVEAALGGADLGDHFDGQTSATPVEIRSGSLRRLAGSAKRFFRPRPILALSGVDGAGKSSLTKALVADMARFGLTPDVIWARPGMRMEWIDPIVSLLKRSKADTPTVARVASGEAVDASSRRGLVGWFWTMLVTATFLSHVWWSQQRRSGLKIYDRHLDDAVVSLDFVYDGVDLRLQRKLIRWLLPRAAMTFYLSVDADTAVARKPGDTFGHHAVETQLIEYRRRMNGRNDVVIIDATDDPRTLASHVLAAVVRGIS